MVTIKIYCRHRIIGFKCGKIKFISLINRKSKIANYKFTTLNPNLGVAVYDDKEMTLADIPGLIEGAHKGTGLGIKFLKHVERCKSLLHLIDISEPNLLNSYQQIRNELKEYSSKLLNKKEIIVLNKIDLIEKNEIDKIYKKLRKTIKKDIFLLSTLDKKSVKYIKSELLNYVS